MAHQATQGGDHARVVRTDTSVGRQPRSRLNSIRQHTGGSKKGGQRGSKRGHKGAIKGAL
eukprot:2056595-Pyramimonas_sp.AAC.2